MELPEGEDRAEGRPGGRAPGALELPRGLGQRLRRPGAGDGLGRPVGQHRPRERLLADDRHGAERVGVARLEAQRRDDPLDGSVEEWSLAFPTPPRGARAQRRCALAPRGDGPEPPGSVVIVSTLTDLPQAVEGRLEVDGRTVWRAGRVVRSEVVEVDDGLVAPGRTVYRFELLE